jgi:hypothetical protein
MRLWLHRCKPPFERSLVLAPPTGSHSQSEQSPCKYFTGPGQIARSLKFLFLQGRFLTVALCARSGAASQLLLDPGGFVRLNRSRKQTGAEGRGEASVDGLLSGPPAMTIRTRFCV